MPTLLGIHGAVTPPGRLNHALQLALAGPATADVDTALLHLGDYAISFADGRNSADFSDDTGAVVEQVQAADMLLIATSIFRASYTGALKNLLDLLPVEALMGKPCGLIGMGATGHHYLAVDTQLRPVLGWFGAYLTPTSVYLQSRGFESGRLTDPQTVASLHSLTAAVIALHRAIEEGPSSLGPLPLAAG